MPTRTVDLLLNLDTEGKPPAIRDLTKWFNELETEAKQVRQELQKSLDPKRAQELDARLKAINSDMKLIHGEAQKRTLEKSLKAASQQANQLRERMEKVQQVGNRIAFAGAAIVTPFVLAVRKYVDTVGESEETSKRIIALSERWQESQVRIGRVTAEMLLPTLEKALTIVEKITAFAEANPEFVQAAVGIGASLVVLGGIVSTTAQIVSTVATIKGLLAGVGIAGGAGVGGGAGMAAAISAGISAAAPIILIAATVVAAAELTRRLVNWALGTDTTWRDIAETARQLFIISAEGWKLVPELLTELFTETWRNSLEIQSKLWNMGLTRIRDYFNGLIQSIVNGFNAFGQYLSQGFSSLASVFSRSQSLGTGVRGYASGGYITSPGLFMGGEAGKEFVMSNATTRAAESMIGGSLNQASLLRALSNGGGGRRVSYYDARKFDSMPSADARRMMKDEILKGLAGAF